VYGRPQTPFVLDFVGLASRWRGRVVGADGASSTVETAAGRFAVPARLAPGAEVEVAARPEKISLAPEPRPGANEVTLALRELVYQGIKTELHFEAGEGDRAVVVAGGLPSGGVKPGDRLRLAWNVADTLVYRDGARVAQ
jgi:putative spermidine/putrescine transport system ATP-binding protein